MNPTIWQEAFLAHLAHGGNVSAAARACGIPRCLIYHQRIRDGDFARRLDAAQARAGHLLEAEAARRAERDTQPAAIADYPDSLLMYLLRRRRPQQVAS